MEWIHSALAILAAFRFTTLFTQDAIWDWPRRTFPRIPWHCGLCMSVWGGILATVFLLTVPWLNWPLGISWLYLAYQKLGSKMDGEELNNRVNAMHAEYGMSIAALVKRSTELSADLASAALREQALRVEIEALKKPKGG